jgi:hypothetical protein
MARALTVEIVGDARSLRRELEKGRKRLEREGPVPSDAGY